MTTLNIRITAPFLLGDLPAVVETSSGAVPILLRAGAYQGDVAGALRLKLLETGDAADALQLEDGDRAGTPAGPAVSVEELFEHGIEIPADGRVEVQISWGTPCHHEPAQPEGKRFGSFEHILCAERVGRDIAGKPLKIRGIECRVSAETQLAFGGKAFNFGQIIALAGDFYAHFDDRAATEFAWAWPKLGGFVGWLASDYRAPTLDGDDPAVPTDILRIVERDKDASRGTAGEFAMLAFDALRSAYPARRYLALASQNFCHFASQPPDGAIDDTRNLALTLYQAYHVRAISMARAAKDSPAGEDAFRLAVACDAFGCHFLTDIFASGHMRVPRRELSTKHGILRGALRMAHAMHGEDNRLGLWCTTRGLNPPGNRTVWRAFGDGYLQRDEARPHLVRVQEAVRSSVAEVFAAYCGAADAGEAPATAHVPVPLPPGDGPTAADTADTKVAPSTKNHYPMYWLTADGCIARREGGPDSPNYVCDGPKGTDRRVFA